MKHAIKAILFSLLSIFPAAGGTLEFDDGVKYVFNPNATLPGLNVGAHTANPNTLANGDLWYNSTTNALMARINGSSVALGAGGGGGSWGTITGTLTDQTDLVSALALKANLTGAALTGATYNGMSITANTGTLHIANAKAFDVLHTLTLDGTDGSTLNIGTGGTLGTAAYTATSAYQAADAELTAIAGLTSAADRGLYFTGSGTASLFTFTSAARSLLDDADAAAMRTTLGLVIGTNVQAFADPLAALSALTATDNMLPYFSGDNQAATTELSPFSRTLLDDIDAAAWRTTLSLTPGADVQEYDEDLDGLAFLGTLGGTFPYTTGAHTWGEASITAAGRTLVAGADAAAQRSTLGLVIGTNVQAYDADLTTWAGVTPGTGVATALAVNIGSAGAPVLFNGAGGTPSSMTGTNITGIPINTGLTIASQAQGDILYHNGTSWTRLGAGTNGHYLKTQGAGASPTWAAVSASPGGSDTYIQINNASAFGGVAGLTANTTTGAITQLQTSLGTSTLPGVTLSNTTAAAVGSQQVTPSLVFDSNGWKTTATASSQNVKFQVFSLPVQGTTAPSGLLKFQSSINGGAASDILSLASDGVISLKTATYETTLIRCGFDNYGIGYNSNGETVAIINSTPKATIGNTLTLANAGTYTFASTANASTGTKDTFLGRQAAANLRQGAADAASPVAQTFSTQSVVAGTSNTAGADRKIDGSQGTGTGNGGAIILETAPPGASGTSQNSLAPRLYVYGGEKTLTESSATIVLNLALAAGKYIGGELTVTTHADDATDFQAITENFVFSAVNKGGTVTATIQGTPSSSTTAASAGTLTTTWTAVANGNGLDIKNNAVSSLTQTTLKCSYQLHLNGDGVATITP